ncbi:unnamed protein product [Symbiodinium microadriaticum]|nr:Thermitase [Symbiodinium sp. KB8]CAE7219439.1 unnamed protein product [Symbiodinium microadriaticum]
MTLVRELRLINARLAVSLFIKAAAVRGTWFLSKNNIFWLLRTAPTAECRGIDVYFGTAQTIRLGACDGVVGYRFEPGAGLNKDCSWAGLDLWRLAADSVPGPDVVGGYGLRFDGTFAAVSTIPPDFWDGISNIQWTGWTASAWVYPSVPPSRNVRLLGRSNFNEMFDVFAMQLTPDFLVRCVAADNPDLGPDACTSPAAQPLLQNTWTHVVCQHEINWMSGPSTGSSFRPGIPKEPPCSVDSQQPPSPNSATP